MKTLQREGGTLIPLDTTPALPGNGFWRTHGPALAAMGYKLVPLKPGTKRPDGFDWVDTDFNSDKAMRRGFRGDGAGIKTGVLNADGYAVIGLDIDCDDPQVVEQYVAWCWQHLGRPLRRDGSRGTMLLYRSGKPHRYTPSHAYRAPGHEKPQRLEVLGTGRQAAVYVEHSDSGQPYYRYPEGELTDMPCGELTEISEQQIFAAVDHFDGLARGAIGWTQVVSIARTGGGEHKAGANQQAPLWKLEAAMAVIPTSVADDYNSWITFGAALHTATCGSALGLRLWDNWSRQSDRYDDDTDTDAKWASFGKTAPGQVRAGAGLILHRADKASPGWRRRAREARAAALAASQPVERYRIGDDVFDMNEVAEKLRRATGAKR